MTFPLKAVAGANFAQMRKEKFEEDNFGFNLHGMSEEKILKTKDTREDFLEKSMTMIKVGKPAVSSP